MNCKLLKSGEAEGKTLFKCQKCGREWLSRYADPAMIHRPCSTNATAAERQGRCEHRGEELRQVDCPSCKGHIRVKVLGCDVFGECSIGKPIPGLACCAGCPQWTAIH